ncbi:PepSY domain-containing protein [Sphingomonas sp.]|uniref:PepSY domain-containing protein n=1 Tax=Sphingomonas sp. TaxID=28214 RepID=UPI00258547DA|nr:PepSY domain-containing protein [Sphingomonas sp.]
MRRWHRLLAPWFALLLLILAATGIATQLTSVFDTPAARPAPAASPLADTPASPPKKTRSALGSWNHWIKKIHSGEEFGPVGIALNLAGGAALLFFAGSGLWMYIDMWTRRRRSRRTRRDRA